MNAAPHHANGNGAKPLASRPLAVTRPDAAHVLAGLATLYALAEWALLKEVRSSNGFPEMLRIADALAVRLWGEGPIVIHGFEVKTDRRDWLRELADPMKATLLQLYCSAWYLVVPAPWKLIVLSLEELPETWGLIEATGSDARVIVRAAEREAEEPSPAFQRALLRAAVRPKPHDAPFGSTAPLVAVTRPALSRSHVGLACGHSAVKTWKAIEPPRSVPCWGCAEKQPADLDVVEAAIADATAEDLERLAAAIDARKGGAR